MLQLRILSGKKAGADWAARHFPVRIGRSPKAHLRLEEDGVWDQHLRLSFERKSGIVLHTEAGALASVNGQPVEQTVLRNGDMIVIGAVKLQFWLGDTRQGNMRIREWLTWLGIAAVSLGQVALVYWLLA